MSDIGGSGNAIHPVGWSFLGAGVGLLWPGWSLHRGLDPLSPLTWNATAILWLVFAVSVFVALFDFFLHQTLERVLLRATGLLQRNPPSAAWAAMWRTRWRSGQSDQEMRRHEGMVSLARAYLVYFFVGGLLLATAPAAPLAWPFWVIAAIVGVGLCGRMWFWHTRQIFVIVNSAQTWEDEIK